MEYLAYISGDNLLLQFTEEKIMSLPSWERGLKCKPHKIRASVDVSLPSWERGLKYRSGFNKWSRNCRSPRGSGD